MKKYYLLIALAAFLTPQVCCAKTINSTTIQKQLESLNKYWIGKELNYPILKETIPLSTDVSLIQMHLLLVEKTLRDKNVDNLSIEQKQNRIKCLDILHNYSSKGVFPKNTNHTNRTPYFIDKFGTACAVGQLIISTGYGEFANRVKEEKNNTYISELNSTYSEISQWATKFGFTIDELAWIQPCYCSISAPGIINVTCNGGSDGSFLPVVSGWPTPYCCYTWYMWNGSVWGSSTCGGCGLVAGNYKCTITDANGMQHDYFATITEPSAITQTVSSTNDNGSCNGSASLFASGGTPGYTYSWTPGGYLNNTITNLCQNTYTFAINDSKGCISSGTVNVGLTTNIESIAQLTTDIYPNPTHDFFNIKTNAIGKLILDLYDINGRCVFSKSIVGSANIDVNSLENGVYTLAIKNRFGITNKKLVIAR